MIELLRKLFARRPQRHFPSRWDGTHETCSCGYNSVWDWDLSKHYEEMGRAGA